jgi:predicted CoA-binding protein
VNPNCGASVLGERAYCALADIPDPVDVVDVFRRSEAAGVVADEAVAIGARGVWFQLDVVDLAAYDRVRAAGIGMVMDRCPAIEWPAHGPR